MHHYHCSYLHFLPSFLIDPFVYSCQKRGEYTISLFPVHICRGRNSLYLSFYYLLYLEGIMYFVQVFQVTDINVPSSSQLLWFMVEGEKEKEFCVILTMFLLCSWFMFMLSYSKCLILCPYCFCKLLGFVSMFCRFLWFVPCLCSLYVLLSNTSS